MTSNIYVDFSVNQEEANNSIKISEEFIAKLIHLIATLSEESIKDYREKAITLFTQEKKTIRRTPNLEINKIANKSYLL